MALKYFHQADSAATDTRARLHILTTALLDVFCSIRESHTPLSTGLSRKHACLSPSLAIVINHLRNTDAAIFEDDEREFR